MGQATETKHTPGPWRWDDGWGAVVSCGEVTRIICPMWTGCNRATMSDADAEIDAANARLIAAAPDLAAQLRQVLTRLDLEPKDAVFPCSAMRESIRAALVEAGIA